MAPLKSVYISPETALSQVIAQLRSQNSPITDFSAGSVARTILEGVSIVLSGQSQVGAQLQLDCYLDTAEGPALDAQGVNWQVPRLPAVAASGKVTIKRESSGSAATIVAGWSQLIVPPSVPGAEGVAVLTTEDANFSAEATEVTVSAVAVLGGTSGNLQSGTFLTPLSPVVGVSSQLGYKVTTAFTGGVNEETDAAYRLRIPLVVQGRQAKGTKVAYEGAVLSVPGVESVGVLPAGTVRSNSVEVPRGKLEVVYLGAESLLKAVEAAVASAEVLDQEPTTACAAKLTAPQGLQRVVLQTKLIVQPGSNTEAFRTEAVEAARKYVNGVGLGGTAYLSSVIETLHGLGNVISITLPLAKFCKFGESTAADIICKLDQAPQLATSDVTLEVEEL